MGPGITVLQEKDCLHLWPYSCGLGLQLSQHCGVVVRVDGLSKFQGIQDCTVLSLEDSAHHFTCSGLCLQLFLQWEIHVTILWTGILTPAPSSDTTSCHQ